MPIGNLTSQLFANIYLNELDQFCKHVLKIHRYARYMDDIIAIAPDKATAHRWREAIAAFLSERLHLDLNAKTTVRPVDRVEFVGYIITARCLKLRKATTRRIKNAFRGICKRYFAGAMTREEFDRRVASYRGMLEPCEADGLRDRLNQIYLHAKEAATISNLQLIEELCGICTALARIVSEQQKVLAQHDALTFEAEISAVKRRFTAAIGSGEWPDDAGDNPQEEGT